MAAKRAEAAAELAAKEAHYKIMQEEIKQKEEIRPMEEQHKRELEMQQSQLERLQIERDMEEARARLEIYDREIKQENVYQPKQPNNRPFIDHRRPHIDPSMPTDVSYLAKATLCQYQQYLVASQCTSLNGEPHSSLLMIRRIFPLLTNFIT